MNREFERIAMIQQMLRPSAEVALGIGDDAAILNADARPQVYTVDCAVEDVHFRRTFVALDVIGYRAVMAALSDLAAMGAQARAVLLSLVLPKTFSDDELKELIEGVGRGASESGVAVIGGNLSAGRELSLHTTCIGAVNGRALTRSGAKPGDGIYVTGVLGAAALGLHCLMREHREPHAQPFIDAWQLPKARLAEGRALAQHASACIDISDGLLQDLEHLCQASRVGATVYGNKLPLLANHQALAQTLNISAFDLALSGGEDYELLFTYPSKLKPPVHATHIGEIVATTGVRLLDASSLPISVVHTGYRHFDS